MDRLYVRRVGTGADDTMNGAGGDDLMYGYAGNDTLNGNDGNDRLLGGDGDDKLNGGNGRDDLFGDNGNDRIVGGAGGDVLNGGLGADTFVFNLAQQSGTAGARDVIEDFQVGIDRIELAGSGVEKMSDLKITQTWGQYSAQVEYVNNAGQTEIIHVMGVSAGMLGEDSFVFG